MNKKELATSLQKAFEEYPTVSLGSFALATGTTYQVLLRESRKPIPGVVYDPEAINYLAIIEACIRKHGENFELPNFEELAAGKTPRGSATKVDWKVGDIVEFRNFKGTFKILMRTIDHIVFMDVNGTKPRVMNNDTFEHQGPRLISTAEEDA